MQLPHISDRLGGRTQIRLGNQLNQRHASAVQVNAGTVGKRIMHRLACVLFQLATVNAHLARPCRRFHDNFATTNNGIIQLANLITLGQVGVKIILAHEEGVRINLCANRQAK